VAAPILVRLRPYAVAIGVVIVAAVIRTVLDPWLGPSVPYLVYYPAIVYAGWYGGAGPGLLTTALSVIAADSRYVDPLNSVMLSSRADVLSLILFAAIGTILSFAGEYLLRADLDRNRFSAIAESTDDAIIATDLESVITAWNTGAERMFGYSVAEAVGRPIALILPDDRSAEEQRLIKEVSSGRRVPPFETIRQRKDGSLVPVSVTVSPIRTRNGDIVGASKITHDITERQRADELREQLMVRERQAREEAVAARDRLAFLADVGAVLTSSLDYEVTLDRAVHLALPRLGDYCSVLADDEHGRLRHLAWGHVVRDRESILQRLMERLLQRGGDEPITFAETIMKSGRTMVVSHAQIEEAVAARTSHLTPAVIALGEELQPYAYVGVPLHLRGRVIGVMAFGTTVDASCREYAPADVELVEEFSRRVSVAIENARLFRHADELNRLKDEFLATLSHEMRTPLSAVLGWARMLSTGHLDRIKIAQAIEAIERNAYAQAKIVDDILDVARGMAGNLELDLQPVDLATIAQRGVEAIAPSAVAKQIQVDVHGAGPVEITADPHRLQQVVSNLLSNAVKFTPSGGRVRVDVSSQNSNAELVVADTGAGIPRAFLPFVFDKFRQADGSFTRQHGGLGLGLAIARHLIELHGGSIEARSDGEGAGSTFVVRLPTAPPRRSEAPA
jgi:PAS domain S-box-containing protein